MISAISTPPASVSVSDLVAVMAAVFDLDDHRVDGDRRDAAAPRPGQHLLADHVDDTEDRLVEDLGPDGRCQVELDVAAAMIMSRRRRHGARSRAPNAGVALLVAQLIGQLRS